MTSLTNFSFVSLSHFFLSFSQFPSILYTPKAVWAVSCTQAFYFARLPINALSLSHCSSSLLSISPSQFGLFRKLKIELSAEETPLVCTISPLQRSLFWPLLLRERCFLLFCLYSYSAAPVVLWPHWTMKAMPCCHSSSRFSLTRKGLWVTGTPPTRPRVHGMGLLVKKRESCPLAFRRRRSTGSFLPHWVLSPTSATSTWGTISFTGPCH